MADNPHPTCIHLQGPRKLFEWAAREFGGTLEGDDSTRTIYSCSDGVVLICLLLMKGQSTIVVRKLRPENMLQLDPELLAFWEDHRGPSTIEEVCSDIAVHLKKPVVNVMDAWLLDEQMNQIEVTNIPISWITSRVGDLVVLHRPMLVSGRDGGVLLIVGDGGNKKVIVRISKVEPAGMASQGHKPGKKTVIELTEALLGQYTKSVTGR